MLRKAGLSIVTLVLCTHGQAAEKVPAADTADLELTERVALYIGSYLSRPDEGARDARPILMRVVAVDPPAGRGWALYSEMRHDGINGDIYRQNLLRRDAIEQLERGYGDDGQLLFGNKDGIRYVWPRIDMTEARPAGGEPQP